MKELQPLNENVIIALEKEKEQKTASGIIIPESAREKPVYGIVKAIGSIENSGIAVGDKVIYKKFSGTELDFEGQNYLVITYADLLAKIVETETI